MTPRKRRSVEPAPGGESHGAPIDPGEPRYLSPVGPAKSVVRLVPADPVVATDLGEPLSPAEAKASRAALGIPDPDRPLVPTPDEVAKLPAGARGAFAARCAARVAPLADTATAADSHAAAALMVAAATVESPVRRWLLCLRRDFDRVLFLARKHAWTDDSPVPPDAFGPMWPKNLTPAWAAAPTPNPG